MNIFYIKDNDGNPSIMFVQNDRAKVIDPNPNGTFINGIDAYSANVAHDLSSWFAIEPPDNFENIIADEYAVSDIESEISERCVIYGEDIKHARIAVGMTQQELSDKFGIPKRSIENWEGGVNKCPDYVESMIIERLEFDKGIVLDALFDLMCKTYESFKDRREADDMHSMIYWEGRARRIYNQYARIAGKSSVANVLGVDVQKNEVKSTMEIIEESMGRID